MTSYPTGQHPDAARTELLARAASAWLDRPWPIEPTSSLTGGGAIAMLEQEIADTVDPSGDSDAILLPSATYALRLALEALGVRAGDDVLLPVLDWPSSYAAVCSLGARPVPVAVDPSTLTIDVDAAARARTSRTTAAVACHLHGTPADAERLREVLRVPVVEDAAGALGSTVHGDHVGRGGDALVLSLGPGKQLDCFEGGLLVTSDPEVHDRATRLSAHPLRQLLSGLDPADADPASLAMRGHPATAWLGLLRLSEWDPVAARAAFGTAAAGLRRDGAVVIDGGPGRASAAPAVPALLRDGERPPTGASPSGAQVLPSPAAPDLTESASALLARTWLVPVAPHGGRGEAPGGEPA